MNEFYGLILAGGKSSRMGEDKYKIVYHEMEQYKYLIGEFDKLNITSFISCREDQVDQFEHSNIIIDSQNYSGPQAGILTSMEQNPKASFLVVACDLPFVDSSKMSRLIELRDSNQDITGYWNIADKRFEPLFAIYEASVYSKMLSYYDQGFKCPQKVMYNCQMNKIEITDQDFLQNANTTADRDLFLKQIQGEL